MIKNGRRGSLSGRITVKGIQGHVAYPQLARNPVHEAVPALAELAAMAWDAGNEYFPPTTWQISNLHAGTGATNVIPGELVVDFNFRFSTASSPESLKARVASVLDKHRLDWSVAWTLGGEPFLTPVGSLVSALTDAIEAETGVNTQLSTTDGTSDGRFIAKACAQVVEFGPVNATIHKVDEHVAVALVTPFGALIYRLAYESLADASVLVLLIVSVGVHFALVGLGLTFFGAEGFRNPSFWDQRFSLGAVTLSGQALIIFAASLVLIAALGLFFERALAGKALRATAVNRLGARLMGISSNGAGRLAFAMAAFIGALSGLLIGPTTTVFYDSGFLIGLKGFVAAVFAGLASYPLALLGALGVGLLESFGSFWASAFKEVIVFGSILPVLLWRSLRDPQREDD